MEHEMRKEINKFKDFLNENLEEKLNISDVIESDFFYKELKRCINDNYTKEFDGEEWKLDEYRAIEDIKQVIKNHLL